MAQEKAWDREYKNSKLLTKENKPQTDIIRFAKFLKSHGVVPENLNILDLGSGAGRNSFYFTELGNTVTGFEISNEALSIAREKAESAGLKIDYQKRNIGDKFPIEDDVVDIVLDITSSNSLTESEREMCLKETSRVLKDGGYFFVKALCKDGDANAKNLLKQFPGKEKDTYVMPDTEIIERVWSREDFMETYSKFFKILHLEKKTTYSRMNNRSYKRNFWIAYLQK